MKKDIYLNVVEAYQNAIANDYKLADIDTATLAEDMQMCDSFLEDEKLIDIRECIIRYRGY